MTLSSILTSVLQSWTSTRYSIRAANINISNFVAGSLQYYLGA